MFLSNRRLLIALTGLAAFIALSCGSKPPSPNVSLPPIDRVSKSYPFSVVEPQVYSCKIVETTGGISRVYFVARNGDRSRLDIDHGQPTQITVIHDGRTIRIDHRTKTYTETSAPKAEVPQLGTTDTMFRSMLYDMKRAKFDKLESTDGVTKYRVASNNETASERFIYVDDLTGFPKRVEMFSIEGNARREVMRIEVNDFTADAAESLFQVPAGFSRTAR